MTIANGGKNFNTKEKSYLNLYLNKQKPFLFIQTCFFFKKRRNTNFAHMDMQLVILWILYLLTYLMYVCVYVRACIYNLLIKTGS